MRCPQLDPPPLIYHDTPDFDWEQYEVPFEAAQIAAPLVSTTNTSSWMRSPALEAIGYMSSLLGFKAESYADS
ncbi:uncharacterized protein JCM10292_000528 [Rhodotorula paludigena]|uniref:uncharacterized protein n=1 Tax=Rhodotorula paludigena TaxID=86838 RepID=UPI003172B81E